MFLLKMEIPELINLKCLQNWGFSQFKNIEEKLLKKDPVWNKDENKDERQGSIPKYATNVTRYLAYCHLSYECYRKGNYVDALENLNQANVTDEFIEIYDTAFKHVVKASRAHILSKLKSVNKAEILKIVNQLEKEKLSDKDEAAFKYIECKMLMHYGDQEKYKEALVLIKCAVQLVEDEAEFCFTYGQLLNRMRHLEIFRMEPSPIEYKMLKQAMSWKENIAIYAITLQETLLDTRFTVCYEIKKMNELLIATAIYRMLEKPDILSGNEIARCIYVIIKIDFNSQLKQCAEIAKMKSDSILTNHHIGYFYLHNKQYKKVLDCFKNEVVKELTFIAGQTLLARYRLNGNSLTETELNEQIDEWSQMLTDVSSKKKFSFYMYLSQFYFLVMDDINKAASMFNQACEYEKEVVLINICRTYKANYFYLLKRDLNKCFWTDEDIDRAKNIINSLPEEITREQRKKYINTSLSVIKKNIL